MSAGLAAVVFDYGGVLTNPLSDTMNDFCRRLAIAPDDLAAALLDVGDAWGEWPMARLEVAGCTEAELVDEVIARLPQLGDRLGDDTFGAHWFRGRHCEGDVLELVREIRASGLRTCLLTNNVREWEPRWRAQLDASLFDLIVDSSREQVRKPDPEIFVRTLHRLGLPADRVLFVDDLAENREAAAALGMRTFAWSDRTSVAGLRARVHAGADLSECAA